MDRIAKFFAKYYNLFLTIALIGAAIGLLLRLQYWQSAGPVLIVSFCTIAFLFAAKGLHESAAAIRNMIRYLSYSVLVIGVLFYLQHWEGYFNLFIAGGVGIAIWILLYFFQWLKNN
jgi:hypothetical protein